MHKLNLYSRAVGVVKTSTAVLSVQGRLAASVRIFVRITYEKQFDKYSYNVYNVIVS